MKVKIHVGPGYNAIGVGQILNQIGVLAPMHYDETTITTVMSDAQIAQFKSGRGAAHRVEELPELKPAPPTPVLTMPVDHDDLVIPPDPKNAA